MTVVRRIDRLFTPSPLGPGFAGPRHTARLMVPPGDFAATNPFFLMADDHTKVGGDFGEAHPHAGLETVTFMLSGSFEDLEGRLDPGDVEWMTSGRGIVHGKDTVTSDDMRLFQLWIALPEDERQSSPRVQRLRKRNMPVRKEAGVEARVYSGRSGDAVAKTMNAAPVTLVDVRLEPNASFEQDLPASYNGFIVVIEGAVSAGDPAKTLVKDQVGWLDRPTGDGRGALRLSAADTAARVLIYAGEPQQMRLAARGPFIAGSEAELAGYFAAYRRGEFPYASSLRQEVG